MILEDNGPWADLIPALRRQGAQVRSDERSEDRPKAHPVGRAIFPCFPMSYDAKSNHPLVGFWSCVSFAWMTGQDANAASRCNFSMSTGSLAWLPGHLPGDAGSQARLL